MGKISRAALITALGLGTGRVIGLGREIFVAMLFGITQQMDVYAITFVLVGVPGAVIINSLQAALVPAISKAEGIDKSRILSGSICVAFCALSLGAIVLIYWIDDLIRWMRTSSDLDMVRQAQQLVFMFLPYYFFNAFSQLGYGGFQAAKQFRNNAFLPLVSPLIAMLALVFFYEKGNVLIVALAVSLGALVEFVFVVIVLRRAGLYCLRYLTLFTTNNKNLLATAGFLIPSGLVLSSMPFFEQVFASGVGEGANSALAFGQRLPLALNGLLASSVGIAVLPFFSDVVSQTGSQSLSKALARHAVKIFFSALFVAVILAASSPWIVWALYERGQFDSTATSLVAAVQAAYFLQLPGMIVGQIYTRAAIAQGKAGWLSIVTLATVLVQIALAWFFVSKIGLPGVGFAAAAASAFNAYALRHLVMLARDT
jgi:putative peptidoglycan lipid II flippase